MALVTVTSYLYCACFSACILDTVPCTKVLSPLVGLVSPSPAICRGKSGNVRTCLPHFLCVSISWTERIWCCTTLLVSMEPPLCFGIACACCFPPQDSYSRANPCALGHSDYDPYRPSLYEDCKLFVICFSMDSRESLNNVRDRVRFCPFATSFSICPCLQVVCMPSLAEQSFDMYCWWRHLHSGDLRFENTRMLLLSWWV